MFIYGDGNIIDELSQIIKEQTKGNIRSINISDGGYCFFIFNDRQINDIEQFFCAEMDASPLAVDTTFNLCDLWITDTAYQNQRLISTTTQHHPAFLGPAMFHFQKRTKHLADLLWS